MMNKYADGGDEKKFYILLILILCKIPGHPDDAEERENLNC